MVSAQAVTWYDVGIHELGVYKTDVSRYSLREPGVYHREALVRSAAATYVGMSCAKHFPLCYRLRTLYLNCFSALLESPHKTKLLLL